MSSHHATISQDVSMPLKEQDCLGPMRLHRIILMSPGNGCSCVTGRCAKVLVMISPTGEVAPSSDDVEAASATEAIMVTPTAIFGADEEKPRLMTEESC